MSKRTKIAIVSLTAVLVLAVTATAFAAGGDGLRHRLHGGGGTCAGLMQSGDSSSAMRQLRNEHMNEMQAWFDKYGADPTSPAARDALLAMRKHHSEEMRGLVGRSGGMMNPGAGSTDPGTTVGPNGGMMGRW